ncbi:MAG: helix-turn-helix transcriptional regulator [Chloroflexota bacterium]
MAPAVTPNDEHFFKTLGTRIAELRKEQGLSQQALADELGIAQQTLAHYEVGRARMPVSLLPDLARFFGVGTDDLLGLRSGAAKRGPAPKLQQHLQRISRLPKPKQRAVMDVLEAMLAQSSR